jgi:two-component system sensor histidine kinase TctE
MEVVKDSLPMAMERHIDLGFDQACDSAWLEGNPVLLKEMVRNLIENALNYTPSSPVHPGVVTARVFRHADSALVLQVEDSGPGIPEAERARVFEPFYRILGTEADGSGLGLPIVMEIAHKHGATLQLQETHPGQHPPGAQFNVVFAKR